MKRIKLKDLKQYLFGLALAFMGASAANAQGIPVIDAANLTQSLQQVIAWGQQAEQMKSQITQMETEYNAISGTRSLGSLFNNPALQNYLPSNWQSVYSQVKSGGYGGLTAAAQTLRNASTTYNCQDQNRTGWASSDTSLCNRSLNKSFQDKAYMQQAYQSGLDRMTQIQQLIGQINSTSDPKGIAEVQARIAGEQAALNDEQTKLNLYKELAATEDKLIQQQAHETDMQRVSATTRAADNLTPVSY